MIDGTPFWRITGPYRYTCRPEPKAEYVRLQLMLRQGKVGPIAGLLTGEVLAGQAEEIVAAWPLEVERLPWVPAVSEGET